jgi:hypothetical protein
MRALEVTSGNQTFSAADVNALDPPGVSVDAPSPYALSGFVVARLKGSGTLMQKRDPGGNWWRLQVQEGGAVELHYKVKNGAAGQVSVAGPHYSGQWFAALFSIEYVSGGSTPVTLKLYTPHDLHAGMKAGLAREIFEGPLEVALCRRLEELHLGDRF